MPNEDGLRTRTPCCGRRVVVPEARSATAVADRTCRKCGRTWRVIVRPLEAIPDGYLNKVEWFISASEGDLVPAAQREELERTQRLQGLRPDRVLSDVEDGR